MPNDDPATITAQDKDVRAPRFRGADPGAGQGIGVAKDVQTRRGGVVDYMFGTGHGTANIPARVLSEIDRREAAAERLIGWVQLGIVVAFSALYFVAPRAEGGYGENFVPMTLAAYFVFTLFRVALSYRITLPGWFLVASIVVDVALLCGLIFSFHIQYQQPAAFYLKAPTMIYLFIFIALRALRFDPRFVLITGVVATLGWLAMVTYALVTDMGQMHITKNYVDYLTSNTILIGAEIDKVLTLLGVTVILSVALYRGRDVLFDAIEARAAANDLRQFFAPEVATTITQAAEMPGAGSSVTREAAILFVDVRGFTSTADRMAPETVMSVLALYQHVALPVIERNGGQIDKFMGDGILATFGAVHDSETYAADALRAAVEVIVALDAEAEGFAAAGWPGTLRTGAGVACGTVTVGVVGAEGRLEFTVIGNPVNRASKLEGANKLLGSRALTDGETLRRAGMQGYAAEAAPAVLRKIEGLTDPVEIVVLA